VDCVAFSATHRSFDAIYALWGQERHVVRQLGMLVQNPLRSVLVTGGEGGEKRVDPPREVKDRAAGLRLEKRPVDGSPSRDPHHVLIARQRAVEKLVGKGVGEKGAHGEGGALGQPLGRPQLWRNGRARSDGWYSYSYYQLV